MTTTTSPPLAANVQVLLQVGERRFTTTNETLTNESTFFASLLSGRWSNALPDGSHFIDADPMLFEHILRYLRRGVLPSSMIRLEAMTIPCIWLCCRKLGTLAYRDWRTVLRIRGIME